jgi:putative transposase
MAQPKRLPGVSYDQLATYFVTTVARNRIKAFDLRDFGPFVALSLIEIAARFKFEVPAYVIMPDHVHFLVEASEAGADLKKFVTRWKQATGYDWSTRTGNRLWQKGYVERVLRDTDNTLSVCRYIIHNPVRAKLVAHPSEYPLCGSTQYEIEHICSAVQMKGWWSGI